jgi:hypothetical protein
LANRHIAEVSSPVCQEDCEDIKHVIFSCKRAKEVWRVMGVSEDIQKFIRNDRSGSILVVDAIRVSRPIKHLNQVGLAELILTGGWYLWWEQRKLVHSDIVQNPTRSAISIATLTTNYLKAENKMVKERVGWRKPPEDFLILNVDASYNYERSTGWSRH